MRIKAIKRLVQVAFVVVILLATILKVSQLTYSSRQQRRHQALFAGILANEAQSKEEMCKSYFGTLVSNLDENSLLENIGAKKAWIRSYIAHVRAYGACFLSGSTDLDPAVVSGLELKLFPLFSGKDPVVTNWDGTVLSVPEGTSNLYWGNRAASFSGRGIVISISDRGFSEATRLIRVLRLIKNELPIQFVHRGDLSKSVMDELVKLARSDNLPNLENSERLPPQDISFVDASGALQEGSGEKFVRFANKWIAALFSTFDEMILMDSDVVPFVRPSELFDLEKYRANGAFFFRDRFTEESTWTTPMEFFRDLHPSAEEIRAFSLQDYRQHTEETGFFRYKAKHVAESGMVVMKRSTHLSGLLMSVVLQFWHETSGPFYGDKELFWLGQAYAAQGAFSFNGRDAAALGELKEDKYTWEVCSTQPAQFDDNGRLLWVNGGLQKCKKGFYKKDFSALKSLRKQFENAEELQKHYQSPIEITGALIPAKKLNFIQNRSKGCIGYVWCASVLRSKKDGIVVNFSQEEIARIKNIQNFWFGEASSN